MPDPTHAKIPRELQPQGAYCDLSRLLRQRLAARGLQLSRLRPARSLLTGGLRSRIRGRGMDFEEVRIYHPGDDVRSIDWRVTARTQVPHTKVFREERERPIFMAVDQRAGMFFGSRRCFKSVLAGHIAATLSWAALDNGDRVGGLVFGDRDQRDIRPRRSKHAVLELLHRLEEYNHRLQDPIAADGSTPLASILEDIRRIAKPGYSVFIISDFNDFDAHCEEALFNLARHTDVSLIHVWDPLEQQLSSNTALAISDGQHRHTLPADQAAFQRAWQEQFQRQLDALIQACQRLSLPLLSYSTDEDLHQRLRERFGGRKTGGRR